MSSTFSGSTFDSSSFDNNTDLVHQKKTSLLDKVIQKRSDLGFNSANLTGRNVEALDADTVRINPSVADKAFDPMVKPVDVRLKSNNFGESFNSYEVNHGNESDPKVAARLSKQRDTINDELTHGWFNPATNQDVYDRGEKAKQILANKLKAVNEGKTGLDFALGEKDIYERSLGDMKFSNENTSAIDAMNTPELNSSYNTPYNFAKQNKDTATIGQALEDTGRLALTGIEGIGSALGYGLEKTGIAPELGRQIQDEHFKHDELLRSHLSDPVRKASQEPLLDANNDLNPNFGWTSLATNVIPSIPGSIVMGGAGGTLAKALGVGAKAALGAETTASKLITNGLGYGTSEGVFSAIQNADQWGQEQRLKPINEFKKSPLWNETLIKNKGNEEATKEDLINQGQSDIFKSTAVTTGALSGLPGMAGGMYGELFKSASTKITAKQALINSLKGMGEEALQEYPQSLFERRTTNQATKDYIDPKQDVSEGQWNDAAIGGLSGFAMGAMGAGGHIASIDRTKTPTDTQTPAEENIVQPEANLKPSFEDYQAAVDNITNDNRQEVINQGIKDYPINGTLPEKIQMAVAIGKARDGFNSPEHDAIYKQINAEIQLQNFAKGMPNFIEVISDPKTSIEDIQDNLITGAVEPTSTNTGSLFNDIGRTKDPETLDILKNISIAKQKEYAESNTVNDPYVLATTGIETKNLPKESSEVFSAITRNEYADLNQGLNLLSVHVKSATTPEQRNTGISALTKTISKVYSDKVDITPTTEKTVKQALNTINGLVTNKGTITIEPSDSLEDIHRKILPTFGSQPIENKGNEKANELVKANNNLFTALKSTSDVSRDKLDGKGLLPSYREHIQLINILIANNAPKKVIDARVNKLAKWVEYDANRSKLFTQLTNATTSEEREYLTTQLKSLGSNPFTSNEGLSLTSGSETLAKELAKESKIMSDALTDIQNQVNGKTIESTSQTDENALDSTNAIQEESLSVVKQTKPIKKSKGKTKFNKTLSLLEVIGREGGLRESAVSEFIDEAPNKGRYPWYKKLNSKSKIPALTLDEMAERLRGHGFEFEDNNALIDKIQNDLFHKGNYANLTYTAEGSEIIAERLHREQGDYEDQIARERIVSLLEWAEKTDTRTLNEIQQLIKDGEFEYSYIEDYEEVLNGYEERKRTSTTASQESSERIPSEEETSTVVESSTSNEISKPKEVITSEEKTSVNEDLEASDIDYNSMPNFEDIPTYDDVPEDFENIDYEIITEENNLEEEPSIEIEGISTKYNPPELDESKLAESFTFDYFPFLNERQLKYANAVWNKKPTLEIFKELQAFASGQIRESKLIPQNYLKNLSPFDLNNSIESKQGLFYKSGTKVRKVFKEIFTINKKPFTVYPNILDRFVNGTLGTFSNKDSLRNVEDFHNVFKKALGVTLARNNILSNENNKHGSVNDDPFVLLLKDKHLDENILFAASLSALDLIHSSTQNIINTDESINSIFGDNSELGVTPQMRNLFGSGRVMNREATNVGRAFLSMLGIKSNNIIMQRKMESAAGLHIIRALLDSKYLEASFVPKPIMEYYHGNREGDEPSNIIVPNVVDQNFLKEGTYFVTVANKDGKLTTIVKDLLDETKKGLKEIGENLNINFNKNLPSSKRYSKKRFFENLGNTWKDTFTKYDETEKNVLLKYSNIAHSIKTRASQHPLAQIGDFIIQIGLGHSLSEIPLDVNKKAEDGKRLQLSRDLQAVRDSEEIAKDTGEVYFNNQIIKQGRVQMSGGSQNNKLMRWLFAPESMKRVIKFDDSNESKQLQFSFKKAVVGGFGGKLNQLSDEAVLSEFNAIAKKLESFKEIFDRGEFTVEDQNKLLKVIWKDPTDKRGGEGYHTYAALLDTIEWMKGKDFESHLMREDDGISNGMAIGYLTYNGGKDPELLGGVAIFNDPNETYITYRATKDNEGKAENKDPYELLARQAEGIKPNIKKLILSINYVKNIANHPVKRALLILRQINNAKYAKDKIPLEAQLLSLFRGKKPAIRREEFGSVNEFKQAAKFIFENAQISNELLFSIMSSIENLDESIGRSWAKQPTLQTVYGSGSGKIAKDIGHNAIARIYSKVQQLLNNLDNEDVIKQVYSLEDEVKNITNVDIGLRKILNISELSDKDSKVFETIEDKVKHDLQKFKLDSSVQNKVIKQFELFYTPLIKTAINDKWNEFIANRQEVNSVMNLGNSILKSAIETEITNIINKSIVDNEGFAVFTKGDLEKVYTKFESILPAVSVPTIDGNTKKLHFWSMDSTNKADPLFKVQTNNKVSKKGVHIQYIDKDDIARTIDKDIDSKSDTGHAIGFVLDNIGVKMPIMSIHHLDSLPVKNIMQSNYKSLLVHDGFHGAMDEVDKLSYIGNKTLFENISKFNPFEATLEYFKEVNKYVKITQDENVLNSIKYLLWNDYSEEQKVNVLTAFVSSMPEGRSKELAQEKLNEALTYDIDPDNKNKRLPKLFTTFINKPENIRWLVENKLKGFTVFTRDQTEERQDTLDSIEAFGNYGGNETFKPKVAKVLNNLSSKELSKIIWDNHIFHKYIYPSTTNKTVSKELQRYLKQLYTGKIITTQNQLLSKLATLHAENKILSNQEFDAGLKEFEKIILKQKIEKTKTSESNKEEVTTSTTQTNEDTTFVLTKDKVQKLKEFLTKYINQSSTYSIKEILTLVNTKAPEFKDMDIVKYMYGQLLSTYYSDTKQKEDFEKGNNTPDQFYAHKNYWNTRKEYGLRLIKDNQSGKVKLQNINKQTNENSKPLGSTPDAEDLLTDIEDLKKDITKENIVSEFDAMPKGDDETHNKFLRNFVSQVIAPVVEATELLLFSKATYTYGQYSAELKKVAINLGQALQEQYSPFKMSAQEVFAHEFSHAVTWTAYQMPKNGTLKRKIDSLFYNVRREFNKAKLVDPSLAKWDYVFNNTDSIKVDNAPNSLGEVTTTSYDRGIQEFIAFGTTNKEFRDLVKRLQPKQLKVNQVYEGTGSDVIKEASWLETITNVFKKVLDSFMRIAKGQDYLEPLTQFDTNVRLILAANTDKPFVNVTAIMDKFEAEVARKTNEGFKKGLKFIAKGRNSKVQFIRSIAKYADVIPTIGGFQTNQVVRQTLKLITNPTARQFALDLVKDIADVNENSKPITNTTIQQKTADAERNKATDSDENNWSKRITLNHEQDIAYNNVLVRGDYESLNDAYGIDAIKLLKDKSFRDKEIKLIGDQIPTLKSKALNLANLMVHGKNMFNGMTEHNAVLIAKQGRNIPQDKYQNEIDLVTKLSRLYAIGLQDENQVNQVISLLESNSDGMKQMLKVHKELKKQQLSEIDALTVIDGKTHTTLDPNKTIFLGTKEDEKHLVSDWKAKVIGKLDRDPNDPLSTEGILYLVDVKMQNDWDAKAMATTDITPGSSNFQTGIVKTDRFKAEENREKAKLKEDGTKTKNHIFTRNNSNVSRVAIHNAQGKIIRYEYILDRETQEKYLNPRINVLRDLAAQKNGTTYRAKAYELNHKLIDALYDYWKRLGHAARKDMIWIGSDSKYKDLYNTIPTETKEYITKVFGTENGFYMAEEELREVFGYRKQSITNWIQPVQADELKKTMGNMIYEQAKRFGLNQANIKALETMWIEGIAIAKDTIVVKSGVVSAANESSNFMTAKLAGVPVGFYYKNKISAMKAEQEYRRDSHAYLSHLSNAYGNPEYITKEIAQEMSILESALSTNEMSYLHDEGLASTVAEEGSYKDKHQTMLYNKTERARNIFDKLPKVVKDTLKVSSIAEGTKIYKLLDEIAQMGDITSRHVLVKWEEEKARQQGKTFDKNKAIDLSKFLFIQYHTVTNDLVQYGNDIGLLMFTKFAVKALKVLTYMVGHHPARLIALGLFEEMFTTTNWIWDTSLNKFANMIASMMATIDASPIINFTLTPPAYMDDRVFGALDAVLPV